jgi:hypothetical protein
MERKWKKRDYSTKKFHATVLHVWLWLDVFNNIKRVQRESSLCHGAVPRNTNMFYAM